MDGPRVAVLLLIIMCSTVLCLPWAAFLASPEGDYSETCEVSYDRRLDVTVTVPSSSDAWFPFGFPYGYWRYVTPDDPAVVQVADTIQEHADRYEMSQRSTAQLVLSWVQQNIDYVNDREGWGMNDRWQLPCETLARGTGDCEDAAILFVSICNRLGFETVLVHEPGHVGAAVLLDKVLPSDSTVSFEGKEYVTAEATGSRALGVPTYDADIVMGTDGPGTAYWLIMAADVVLLIVLVVCSRVIFW